LIAVGITQFDLHVETPGPAERGIEAFDVIRAHEEHAAVFARGAVDGVEQTRHRDALVLGLAAVKGSIEILEDD
jgi:hypothetical protein